MKTQFIIRLIIFTFLFSSFRILLNGQIPSNTNDRPMWQAGKIYLKINNNSNIDLTNYPTILPDPNNDLLNLFSQFGVTNVEKPFSGFNTPAFDRTYRISFSDINSVENFINNLNSLNFVDYAEKVAATYTQTIPNDPIQSYFLNFMNSDGASNIHQTIPGASGNTVVAIIDDAVMTNHEDLFDNINALNRDVADGDNDPNPPFTNDGAWFGHGTAVASIAGGVTNNNKGLASIGWSNSIMSIKCVKDNANPSNIDYAYDGIAWAATQGAKVINMSFAGLGFSHTQYDILVQARSMDIVLVAAAGNNYSQVPLYPAAYGEGATGEAWEIIDRTLIIAVAGLDNNNDVSFWGTLNGQPAGSNFGNWVDISAYGTDIDVAMKDGLAGVPILNHYFVLNGTSMAAPIVSGITGVMRSYKPTATATEIYNCLVSSANPDIYNNHPNNIINTLGYGRIDAEAALSCIISSCSNPLAVIFPSAPTICPGSNVTLTANPGNSYVWSNGATTQNISVNNVGTYSVTVTFSGGCTASASINLIAADTQAHIIVRETSGTTINDGVLCEQNGVELYAYFGTSYLWNDGGTHPFRIETNNGGNYPVIQNYSVTITGAGGCPNAVSTASISLTWNAPPAAFLITASGVTNFCDGEQVQLLAPTGLNPYQWFKNNNLIFNQTSIAYNATNTGSYKCRTINSNGCIGFSNSIDVVSNPKPTITVSSSTGSLSMCAGPTHQLLANINAGIGATVSVINWFIDINGTLNSIPGANGSISYAPTQSGNYQVFVRNSFGCGILSIVYSVIITQPPSVNITPPQCNGSPICATTGFTSYSWTPTNATTACITPLTPGVYTVTVTNSNGCTASVSNDLTTLDFNCCGIFQQTLTQSDFNNNISLSGQFNLNSNITINSDITLSSCTIAIAEGVSITVPSTINFTIEGASRLYSCGDMWKGIIALNGCTVNIIEESSIEDAQFGIEARNGSIIHTNHVFFLNNYVGIFLSPVGTIGPISVNTNIKVTEFYSNTTLKAGYTGQNPQPLTKPLAGILMDRVSDVTIVNDNIFRDMNYGIFAMNSNLSVKEANFLRINSYDNYNVGLNIPLPQPWGYWGRYSGSGIFCVSQTGIFSLYQEGRKDEFNPDFFECKYGISCVSTGITSGFNHMDNCDFGYHVAVVQNADVVINDNNIDFNKFGIVSLFNAGSILHWTMANVLRGGSRPTALDGTVNMPKGIVINENSGYSSAEVKDNIITITPHLLSTNPIFREAGGIFLNGVSYSDVDHNDIIIENLLSTNIHGLSLYNSDQNEISCNIISGTRTTIPVNDPDIAMRFSKSKSNYISCNATTNTSIGAKFIDLCKEGGDYPTVFRTNDIGFHYHGLLYSPSARVDPQINKGNSWLSNYFGSAATNQNGSLDGGQPVFQIDIYRNNFNSSPSQVVPSPWFVTNNDEDENCDLSGTPRGTCALEEDPHASAVENYEYLIKIAQDVISNTDFDEETRWNARVQLYEMLLKNSAYMGGSSALANFYADYAGTTIQQVAQLNIEREKLFSNQSSLVQIVQDNALLVYAKSQQIREIDSLIDSGNITEIEKDSLVNFREVLSENIISIVAFNTAAFNTIDSTYRAEVDLLNTLNQTNQGIEMYEKNEQNVNEVYLASVAIGEPEKIFNYAANILNIATQCPLVGAAVYRARALYSLIDPEMDYNDGIICLQSGYLLRMSRNISGKSKLYPNPATDEVTLIYNVNENSMLQILDGLGRIINIYRLNPKEISKTINVTSLESGMYLYRIVDNAGNMIDTGQFIVNNK